MKKLIVLLIAVLLIASFGGLIYYGLTHARGVPVSVEKIERTALSAPFIDKDIDFSRDLGDEVWQEVAGKEIRLLYQVMVLPWPKTIVPYVEVKAFHNKKDIYFHMSWKDDTEDRVHEISRFSDGCAVMFPIGESIQTPTLMMGFLGKANLWHWKASQDREFWSRIPPRSDAYADLHYPFEEEEIFVVSKKPVVSAASDLVAVRVATVTPKEEQRVEGRGFWKEGVWHVVMRRSLEARDTEIDAAFTIGKKQLCAFAVWNGSKGDRGGRKSISDWVELTLQ